jgi:hypothetical protein
MSIASNTRKFLKRVGLGESAVQKIGGGLFTCYGLLRGERWLKLNPTPSRFVILTAGRSGSTSLCDFLDSHDLVKCQSELLIQKRSRPMTFLCGMANYYLRRDICWGFKAKLNQIITTNGLNERKFLDELVEQHFKIIYLRRENVVRSAISGMLGHQRKGRYHDSNSVPEHLDPAGCVWNVRRALKNQAAEESLLENYDYLPISFERHIANSDKSALEQLLVDFLQIPAANMATSFGVVNAGSIWDQVENSEEVKQALSALSLSTEGF